MKFEATFIYTQVCRAVVEIHADSEAEAVAEAEDYGSEDLDLIPTDGELSVETVTPIP